MSGARNALIARNRSRRIARTGFFGAVLILISCLLQVSPVYPSIAAPDAVRWTRVDTPLEGRAGNWVLAAGSDIRRLKASADGALYAVVSGLSDKLYRSTDGAYSWEQNGNVKDEIVDIAAGPEEDTIYYATISGVYRSTNGGRSFEAMPSGPGGAGSNNIEITSLDVTRAGANIIVVGTRDGDGGEFGGVYMLDESEIIPEWQDTGIGGQDVVAIAFPPDYADTRLLVAVATDEVDTYIGVKTGNAGWSNGTGSAVPGITATSASIAFPLTEDGATTGDEFTCFVAIATGTGEGDVYRIDANGMETSATDLDAGSACGRADMDISGLEAFNNGESVVLIAGAAEDAMTCTSDDGGETWTRSRKAPTGDSGTGVFLPPGSGVGRTVYAFTSGGDSALSVSRDDGITWNQLSFIDNAIESIIDIAPSPDYSSDSTMFMLTFGNGPSSYGLWRSQDGGNAWERTLSGSIDAVDSLRKAALPPEYGDDCRKVFVAGESRGNPAIWESDDNGQTFRRRYIREPATNEPVTVDAWAIPDKTTLVIGSYDGTRALVNIATDGSVSSESIPAGELPIRSMALSPEYSQDGTILAGNTAGQVYIADCTSSSFEPVPPDSDSPFFSGPVTVAFDPRFSENHIVYAADSTAGGGIFRFEIGKSDYWESIDGTLPEGATLKGVAVSEDGALYAVNSSSGGGMERSLNPAHASGAGFETVSAGLSDDAALYGLWLADRQIWSVDAAANRLITFIDTLTLPPVLLAPADGASAAGRILDHTARDVNLDWETMEGATAYEWECSYNDDFASGSGKFTGSTAGTSALLPALEPATTYHWRVRAAGPVLSPWSGKRSFTTVMDTEAVVLRPESPPAGAAGVAVKPVFQWTAVIGAQGYELIVSTDPEMNNPVIAMTGDYALPGNVWQGEISLERGTTYYWKVRATGESTRSEWSTIGVFTTEAAAETDIAPAPLPPVEEMSTPEDSGIVASLPLAPTLKEPTPAPATTVDGFMLPDLIELPGVPDWIIYLIGILLSIIILALTIILAIVLRIKRAP